MDVCFFRETKHWFVLPHASGGCQTDFFKCRVRSGEFQGSPCCVKEAPSTMLGPQGLMEGAGAGGGGIVWAAGVDCQTGVSWLTWHRGYDFGLMSECPVVFTRRRDERRVFMCVNVFTSAVQGTVAVYVCVPIC